MPASQIYYSGPVVLTDAQIKLLPTTPVEIVSSPGTGKALVFHSGLYVLHSEALYEDVESVAFVSLRHVAAGPTVTNLAPVGDGNFFDASTGDLAGWMTPDVIQNYIPIPGFGSAVLENMGYSVPNVVDKPLLLVGSNGMTGNFTGGHTANTLTVHVFYNIIDM